MTWRDAARPIVQRVIEAMRGKPEAEVRRALSAACPADWRVASYPQKAWQAEVRAQLGAKVPPACSCGHQRGSHRDRGTGGCIAADCTCEHYDGQRAPLLERAAS
jgi:hypothetical protein